MSETVGEHIRDYYRQEGLTDSAANHLIEHLRRKQANVPTDIEALAPGTTFVFRDMLYMVAVPVFNIPGSVVSVHGTWHQASEFPAEEIGSVSNVTGLVI